MNWCIKKKKICSPVDFLTTAKIGQNAEYENIRKPKRMDVGRTHCRYYYLKEAQKSKSFLDAFVLSNDRIEKDKMNGFYFEEKCKLFLFRHSTVARCSDIDVLDFEPQQTPRRLNIMYVQHDQKQIK